MVAHAVTGGGVALPAAARTAAPPTAELTNAGAKGILVVLDVTAASGTGGLTVAISARDPATGKKVQLRAANTAVTTVGMRAYLVYPGAAAAAGGITATAGFPLPEGGVAIDVGHGDGSGYKYSVGYVLLG